MPWMEESVVEQRLQFVLRVRKEEVNIAKACREFGISRPTAYKWLARYDEEGLDGLEDRSRAPESIPHKTDEKTEKLVCALRRKYPRLGPKKLRAWLVREHPEADWPAPSTIGNILKRNGLVEPRKTRKKSPAATKPLAEADAPNRIWSADYKGQFELEDGSMCYPLTVTDNYSRMILGCFALPSTGSAHAKSCFEQVFSTWGVPWAIRTDNGAPFASIAVRGLSSLSAWWLALGIDHERIEPGKPQQNGRHERMHLTLKQETTRPAASTLTTQQKQFDDFCAFFNELRPHEALDQTVPAKHHRPSETTFDGAAPTLKYPECDVVRSVRKSGEIVFAGQQIYVSQALGGRPVGLVEVDVDVWMVNYAGYDLGFFEPGESTLTALEQGAPTSRNTL